MATRGAKLPVCSTPGHFFRYQSHRQIGRLLRDFLNAHHLTPSELLHSSKHLRTLSDADSVLDIAVRTAAAAQAEATNTSPIQRLEVLSALVAKVHSITLADDRKSPITTLDRHSCVSKLRTAMDRLEGADLTYRGTRLIVRYLEPCDGWREKIDALLVIAETLARHPETARGVPLVDVVLGELLRNRVALDKILGPAKSLGHRLADIAYLHEAKLDVRGDMTAPNLVGRLNTILNKFPMRAVRAGLAFQVRLELASRAQIVSVEVVDELRALAELHQTLRSGESYVGGDGVSQLLERRILRTLGPGGSSEFLSEQPAKSDELETLIGVHDKLSETAAKKMLTGLIERAFDDEDLAEQLFNGDEDTQRLRTIGRLYEVIERSRLSKEHKQRFCEKTQNIQIGFIDERSFSPTWIAPNPTRPAKRCT